MEIEKIEDKVEFDIQPMFFCTGKENCDEQVVVSNVHIPVANPTSLNFPCNSGTPVYGWVKTAKGAFFW